MNVLHKFAVLLCAVLCLSLPASCQDGGETDVSEPAAAGTSQSADQSQSRPEPPEGSAAGSPSSAPGGETSASSGGGSGADISAPPEPGGAGPVQNTELYILMYHDFVEGDGADCNVWTLPIHRFREDLQWLSDHGYTAVLPSQLAAGEPLPERAVMITLDDGYESNYTLVLPVLREFNVGVVVSLIVNHMDHQDPGWLTWDMCREMSESGLVEFGSHTYECHAGQGILRRDGERRKAYEARVFPDIEKSISMIQSEVGNEVIFFAYPHGTADEWASDFLKDHFSVTVTTNHGPASISKGLYSLNRCNVSMGVPVGDILPD